LQDEPWTVSRCGRLEWLARAGMDVRLHGMDIFLQTIEGDNPTAAHWHMADELFYVLRGRGHTLEWQVEAGIDDRYYARVARRPPGVDWEAGGGAYIAAETGPPPLAEGGPPGLRP